MIVDMPNTTISKVSKRLVSLREQGGAVALGRVLTLVIETNFKGIEEAIAAANDASREHPSRVIVLADDDAKSKKAARLDAQIRIGGDAGASEVIVLRAYGEAASDAESLVTGLLLPDAPVVAWWPREAPVNPAKSAIGRIASRRITDTGAQKKPQEHLRQLAANYAPGDSDFAWTRLTLWRAQLAVVLDQAPFDSVTSIELTGAIDSPSIELMAAWLQLKLKAPVKLTKKNRDKAGHGLFNITLVRKSGNVVISRLTGDMAIITQPGQPDREITLPSRTLRECLAEDLRRLDADDMFGQVLKSGFKGKPRR
jgi:glucose-6-phosphate dehydrogenase assembly protein OpcA